MGKETGSWQRVPKGVKEGNSPKHRAQYKLGFERVEIVRKAADVYCWVESTHQEDSPGQKRRTLEGKGLSANLNIPLTGCSSPQLHSRGY